MEWGRLELGWSAQTSKSKYTSHGFSPNRKRLFLFEVGITKISAPFWWVSWSRVVKNHTAEQHQPSWGRLGLFQDCFIVLGEAYRSSGSCSHTGPPHLGSWACLPQPISHRDPLPLLFRDASCFHFEHAPGSYVYFPSVPRILYRDHFISGKVILTLGRK